MRPVGALFHCGVGHEGLKVSLEDWHEDSVVFLKNRRGITSKGWRGAGGEEVGEVVAAVVEDEAAV